MMNIRKEAPEEEIDKVNIADIISKFISEDHLDNYTSFIRECKTKISIPVIASINCHTVREWTSYAKMLEKAGADAIELNVMLINTEKEYLYGKVEETNIEILKQVKKDVKIPVIMKIGREFTNIINLINRLQKNKADGIVMFNKSYRNEVDLEEESLIPGAHISDKSVFTGNLKWVSIASSLVPGADIAISGAVYDGENIIKAILCGAKVTEICSTIYKNGPDYIPHLLSFMTDWMQSHNYETIEQFRGKLNSSIIEDENLYERIQFMKHYSSNNVQPKEV